MFEESESRIRSWKQAFEWLKCDLIQRGCIVPPQSYKIMWLLIKDPINFFMLLLRLNELTRNKEVFFVSRYFIRYMFRRKSIKLGFSIPPNVFCEGLSIVHYGNIVVNSNVRVGKNCRIHVGVNIGGGGGLVSQDIAKKMSPVLGDNIYIGPGVKMFGPITISSNIVIGANSVVNKDFLEPGVTIAGIPAIVISQKGSESMIVGNKSK